MIDGHDAPGENCFADEVAIDFPSAAPAVARIRRGLQVDEPSGRWLATVPLSGQQARRGATVPLEVPVRLTCHVCGGRGESWTEICQLCAGDGLESKLHAVQVTLPGGVLDGDRFHFTLTLRQHVPTRVELRVQVR